MVSGTRCPAWSDQVKKWSESRAAAPKGRCPVGHRGEPLCTSVLTRLIKGLEELILGLKRLIFGLSGLILGLRGLIWGLRGALGGGWMDRRTDGRTDVWKFTPVSYRTSVLWGRCPALTPLLHLITLSRASGTADHVRSLDD